MITAVFHGDTTPPIFLLICAAVIWAGAVTAFLVSRRRLRREDATQKGQGND